MSLDRVWVAPAGERAPPEELLQLPGGQIATAALALARLGHRVAWGGAVGGDAAGETALAPLRAAGVDLGDVRRIAAGRTRRALVRVDADSGEREIFPERDPRVVVAPEQLPLDRIRAARVLLVDAEDPEATLAAVRHARGAGVLTVLDADAPVSELSRICEFIDFPIVSRALAEALGNGSVREGLQMLAQGVTRLAVVTLGAEGCLAVAPGGGPVISSPGFEVDVRDTTGAGDAFHAGFVSALLEGRTFPAALRFANAVAALNCAGLGAQAGLPSRRAVEGFLVARSSAGEELA
ncbi:MAG: carbohydrate kinase family protein [Myxococcota bacterium]|nr:carbohydrate kinase family protein [Myxococcota bacterium]